MSDTTNSIGWFEIAGSDPAKSQEFYGSLFNWTFNEDPGVPNYRLADTGGVPGGVTSTQAGMPATYAIFGVQVADVAATCTAVADLGGKVLVGPEMVGETGLSFANLADPDGNVFGVFCPPAA